MKAYLVTIITALLFLLLCASSCVYDDVYYNPNYIYSEEELEPNKYQKLMMYDLQLMAYPSNTLSEDFPKYNVYEDKWEY